MVWGPAVPVPDDPAPVDDLLLNVGSPTHLVGEFGLTRTARGTGQGSHRGPDVLAQADLDQYEQADRQHHQTEPND